MPEPTRYSRIRHGVRVSLRKVAIIGAGGFGREVLDIFDAINAVEPTYDVVGFIVDPEYGSPGTVVNAKLILGGFEWLAGRQNDVELICAVGAPELRLRMVQRAYSLGARFCSVRHPTVVASQWLSVGVGSILAAACVLTNQIRIGSHVQVNLDCTIGHDCTLDNFVTVAPGVHISGNVTIGEGAFVGTGANLLERVKIGRWAVVGAGSTVRDEVPPNSVVVGLPARVIKNRGAGWHLA